MQRSSAPINLPYYGPGVPQGTQNARRNESRFLCSHEAQAAQEEAIATKGFLLTPADPKCWRSQNRIKEHCPRAPGKALERSLKEVLKDE